ncbi:uncharacterized protein F4822DRAFT_429951 [Hypoxylon trugodes]|uniref:uncharacterized protein n=1 Tax=Hypoxylon trugodes TaxID=326681 RepID=UPI0021A0316C|nr:uncharacterized protein F4822DRAFT_429951 [Hypoxylon trugodes]KAI1387195.1 hypothetical protein F4822DRAFT_429951 [Hypoxylon trugodes]
MGLDYPTSSISSAGDADKMLDAANAVQDYYDSVSDEGVFPDDQEAELNRAKDWIPDAVDVCKSAKSEHRGNADIVDKTDEAMTTLQSVKSDIQSRLTLNETQKRLRDEREKGGN